jgi:hypothetical protein
MPSGMTSMETREGCPCEPSFKEVESLILAQIERWRHA